MPTPGIDVLKHQTALWEFAFLCWNLTYGGKTPARGALRIRKLHSYDDCGTRILDALRRFEPCFRSKFGKQRHMDIKVNSLAGVFPLKVRGPRVSGNHQGPQAAARKTGRI
jgi:hypothetical protein